MGALLYTVFLRCPFGPWRVGGEGYVINRDRSEISGSIKYTVIGMYRAKFDEFSGVLHFDPENLSASSVLLKIKTATVKSAQPSLDNIVRSRRLLDVKSYPETIFRSKTIKKTNKPREYLVVGELTLHGVTQEIQSFLLWRGPIKIIIRILCGPRVRGSSTVRILIFIGTRCWIRQASWLGIT